MYSTYVRMYIRTYVITEHTYVCMCVSGSRNVTLFISNNVSSSLGTVHSHECMNNIVVSPEIHGTSLIRTLFTGPQGVHIIQVPLHILYPCEAAPSHLCTYVAIVKAVIYMDMYIPGIIVMFITIPCGSVRLTLLVS